MTHRLQYARLAGRRCAQLALVAAVLAACRGSDSKSAGASGSEAAPTHAAAVSGSAPATPYDAARAFHRTTAPDAAIRNLDAAIAQDERSSERAGQTVWHEGLIANLIQRASALGRVEDYARALARGDEFVARAPNSGHAYLARARARAAVHEFADAAADLDRAETLRAPADQVRAVRANIALATGDLARARALHEATPHDRRDFSTLFSQGYLYAQLGEHERAEASYREALGELHVPSPFPFAALCFQWGLLYEKRNQPGDARALYELARARLPQHAEATAHLAALLHAAGDTARAAELLRELVRRSDNPEFAGQLAEVEAALGDRDRAAALIKTARDGYEALLARLPNAFADHAARFYLGVGADPARAHELAQLNLGVRKTFDAYQLAIEAALAAGDVANACDTARAALTPPPPHAQPAREATPTTGRASPTTATTARAAPPAQPAPAQPASEPAAPAAEPSPAPPRALQFAAWRAFSGCGDQARADELARALGITD